MVGGQLSQGKRNLLTFEIRFATNPHFVPGCVCVRGGGGGVTLTPSIRCSVSG